MRTLVRRSCGRRRVKYDVKGLDEPELRRNR